MVLTEKHGGEPSAVDRIRSAEGEANPEDAPGFTDFMLQQRYLHNPEEIPQVEAFAKRRWDELWTNYNQEGSGGLTARQIESKKAEFDVYINKVAKLVAEAGTKKGIIDQLISGQQDDSSKAMERLTMEKACNVSLMITSIRKGTSIDLTKYLRKGLIR